MCSLGNSFANRKTKFLFRWDTKAFDPQPSVLMLCFFFGRGAQNLCCFPCAFYPGFEYTQKIPLRMDIFVSAREALSISAWMMQALRRYEEFEKWIYNTWF